MTSSPTSTLDAAADVADDAAATPVLIGCSHGTDSVAGRAAIRALLEQVRELRPELEVREAFVDVQEPSLDDVAAGLATSGTAAVIVPVLLSTGFHVKKDIGEASASSGAAAAPVLGPHPVLAELLRRRLAEGVPGGLMPADRVVLGAAGSSDPEAAAAVAVVGAELARLLGVDVVVAALAGSGLRVADAVAALAPDAGGRRIVATYLLAPGYFLDRLHETGADVYTAPLAPDPLLAGLIAERYDEALTLP